MSLGCDKCPDGPRYKALGNSMATNVMAWIGKQIQQAVDYPTKKQNPIAGGRQGLGITK